LGGPRRENDRHRRAFETWYHCDRNFIDTHRESGVPEPTLRDWAERYNWHIRADQRDERKQTLAERVEMETYKDRIARTLEAADLIREKGIQYYLNKDVLTGPEALNAIKLAAEIYGKIQAVPGWIMELLGADEATLERLDAQLSAEGHRTSSDSADDQDAE
jgi:glucan-binding YG repeat protein